MKTGRHRRRRAARRHWLVVVLAAASLVATAVVVSANAQRATGESPPVFYLDVGASASLGVQPTGVVGHNGGFTKFGYGDDLVRLEAARGVDLVLDKVGCMGETAPSMLSGDKCHTLPTTQLSLAIAFLRAHHDDRGVVSIDIGFNDIRPCLWVVPLAGACAHEGLEAVKKNMPSVLRQLRGAAGPDVSFVGLTYADPFLARYVKPPGPTVATQSLTYMNELNAELRAAYGAVRIPVANVPAAFESTDTAMTTLKPFGSVPVDVAQVCRLTWMCTPAPYGPDDHPNKAGYLLIARTIMAALPSGLR